MTHDEIRRHELSDFLRTRRARFAPAGSLLLYGQNGTLRMWLAVQSSGSPSLRVLDKTGKTSATFASGDTGGALFFSGENGEHPIELSSNGDASVGLNLR